MLHAGLVANLLVAIGGVPMFYDQKTDFNYPSVIDHMGGENRTEQQHTIRTENV
jgi:hypothetical protein